ncbi:MAG: nickel-dependent hydrogenase large subunit, partial [Bilophila sp.]
HLAGQDYFRCPDTVPFTPRYEHPDLRLTKEQNALAVDEYLEALEVRQTCHELVALFGGRMPHLQGILAGGAAAIPTREVILEFAARLKKIRAFVENRYLPLAYRISAQYADLFAMAHGYRNALCAGVFPLGDGKEFFGAGLYLNGKDQPFDKNKIHEDVRYAWFASDNEKQPDVDKAGAYSFIKAPTYAGQRVEVGPLARMWVNDLPLSSMGRTALAAQFGITAQSFRELGEDRAFSIMGRNIARAEEVYALIGAIEGWLRDLEPGAPTFVLPDVPEEGEGFACTEAPRGALVHALRIKKHKIAAYTVIAASMWNCSPRDASGQRGAIEEALLGVAVPDVGSPVNVGRVIRAFDP